MKDSTPVVGRRFSVARVCLLPFDPANDPEMYRMQDGVEFAATGFRSDVFRTKHVTRSGGILERKI